jgi:DNA polymerase-3 subunit epsilon
MADQIRRILIVDTETTGLDPVDGSVIEVGAILFDVLKFRSVIAQTSFLLPCLINPAENINGIPQGLTQGCNDSSDAGLEMFKVLLESADAVVAHNVRFDKQWFDGVDLPAIDKPWICSMEDIRWPAKLRLKSRPSVTTLALAYGVPVWAAHRALTDCIYLAQVFERCDDLAGLLEQAMEPKFLYAALVSYDDRQLAKDAGFAWNDPVPKTWTRRLTESEAAKLPFPTRLLKDQK